FSAGARPVRRTDLDIAPESPLRKFKCELAFHVFALVSRARHGLCLVRLLHPERIMGSIAIYKRVGSLTLDPPGRVDVTGGPLALCLPGVGSRLARALVADLGLAHGTGFLDVAASLCRECQIWPVLLTVARTESDARFRQAQSEALFAAQGVRG